MIVWAMAGLIVGWLSSTRLRVDGLGVFLLSTIVLPVVVFAIAHRFDLDVLVGYAVFWIAVQGAYLVTNVIAERRRPQGQITEDDASLERA